MQWTRKRSRRRKEEEKEEEARRRKKEEEARRRKKGEEARRRKKEEEVVIVKKTKTAINNPLNPVLHPGWSSPSVTNSSETSAWLQCRRRWRREVSNSSGDIDVSRLWGVIPKGTLPKSPNQQKALKSSFFKKNQVQSFCSQILSFTSLQEGSTIYKVCFMLVLILSSSVQSWIFRHVVWFDWWTTYQTMLPYDRTNQSKVLHRHVGGSIPFLKRFMDQSDSSDIWIQVSGSDATSSARQSFSSLVSINHFEGPPNLEWLNTPKTPRHSGSQGSH